MINRSSANLWLLAAGIVGPAFLWSYTYFAEYIGHSPPFWLTDLGIDAFIVGPPLLVGLTLVVARMWRVPFSMWAIWLLMAWIAFVNWRYVVLLGQIGDSC